MRKELHVSHIPQPPKPVTIPLSSKKKTKNKKQKNKKNKNYACAFFLGYQINWKDRNVTDIYSFEPNSLLGCQDDSYDVIGSKSRYS